MQTADHSQGIYAILEQLLRATSEPLTCVDLFEKIPDVKRYAETPNRISDYVGHMWRRGLLQRWTAPKTLESKARYAYTWKDGSKDAKPVPDKVRQMPDMKVLKNPLTKPNIQIIEEGDRVVLDFPDFTITVQSKKP